MKNLVILGSTGSIGTQTLEIVNDKKDDFKVLALAAYSNVDLMEKQVREFMPSYVVLYVESAANDLKERIKDLNVNVLSGMEGLEYISTLDECDMLVAAMVGMIGIRPTIAAVKAGKDIALANKETLVTAGHIIVPLCKENNVNLYPVDSEHSAIYQCLKAQDRKMVDKILSLRVFPDENDMINLSLQDVHGSILSVSQFTLYADASKGDPNFHDAVSAQ